MCAILAPRVIITITGIGVLSPAFGMLHSAFGMLPVASGMLPVASGMLNFALAPTPFQRPAETADSWTTF